MHISVMSRGESYHLRRKGLWPVVMITACARVLSALIDAGK